MSVNGGTKRRSLVCNGRPGEYDEIPELTDEMFERAAFTKGGRPVSPDPQ